MIACKDKTVSSTNLKKQSIEAPVFNGRSLPFFHGIRKWLGARSFFNRGLSTSIMNQFKIAIADDQKYMVTSEIMHGSTT